MQTVKPKSRWPLAAWLIVTQLLAVGSLVIWALMAGLSVMAFDTGPKPEAWRFVIAVWAYPLCPLALTIAAWIAFALRKNTLAAVLSTLTFLPPVVLVAVIWVANATWSWFH